MHSLTKAPADLGTCIRSTSSCPVESMQLAAQLLPYFGSRRDAAWLQLHEDGQGLPCCKLEPRAS